MDGNRTLPAGRGCSNPHPSGHSQTRTRTRDPPRVTNCARARARDPRVPYTRGHARLLAKICWEQIRREASRGGRPRIGGSSSSRCGAAAGPSGSRRGATAAGGCGSVAARAPGEARRPAAARSPSGRPLGLQAGRYGRREAMARRPPGGHDAVSPQAPAVGRRSGSSGRPPPGGRDAVAPRAGGAAAWRSVLAAAAWRSAGAGRGGRGDGGREQGGERGMEGMNETLEQVIIWLYMGSMCQLILRVRG